MVSTVAQTPIDDVRDAVVQGQKILTFSVAGVDALSVWTRLRQLQAEHGLWPIITGVRPFTPGRRTTPATFSADLDASTLIGRWLAGEQEDPESVTEIGPMVLTLPEAQRHASEVKRPAAGIATLHEGIVSIQDYRTQQPYPKMFLALVPSPTTWDAPVRLGFGGFNGCPLPAEHGAVLRNWHRRYGLQVVSVTEDRLEFAVDCPPRDAAEALLLACEHFAYCPDLVHQGTGTTVELAGEVLDAPVWSFWWD